MKVFEIFNKIEATSKTKEKIELLKQAIYGEDEATATEARVLVTCALDYQKLYYMKDVPEVEGTGPWRPDWLPDFVSVLAACAESGRTQETKANVAAWLGKQHPDVAKWCRRVILKDLRCGVSTETANKAGYDVPVFEVQLATDGKKCKKVMDLFPALVGPKLDGYRCFAVSTFKETLLMSRNGTIFQNFPQIEEAVDSFRSELGLDTLILDGEIMSDDFNKMQRSAFASKRGTVVGDVKFFVFDTVKYEEFESKIFEQCYFDRYYDLVRYFRSDSPSQLQLVEHTMVTEYDKVLELERLFLEEGYEGAMFKTNIPYYFGKKQNRMLKFKTMESQDCRVTGMYRGEAGKKYENTMGGLIVEQENGETCDVGSGFTDDMRDEFWAAQDEIIGRMVEVKYQELTPDNIMRFPIFKRWRPDKEKK